MQIKQEKNGTIGEARTQALLLDNFIVSKRIPDIEGADFIVEKQYSELEQHRRAKEKITVYGIIQSKFFSNKNEVIIRKEYIEDHEGIKSEFFALLHTDSENGSSITYFFNAQEIKFNSTACMAVKEDFSSLSKDFLKSAKNFSSD